MDLLRKYLLASSALFAPPGDPPGGDPPEDDIIPEPDLDEPNPDEAPDELDEAPDDEGEDELGDEPPPQQQTRGNRDYGALRERARATARENAELTRQLAELRSRPAPAAVAPAETPTQRAERLSLMSPEERIEEMVTDRLTTHERNTQQLAASLLDQSDKTGFEARCAVNPLFKKLAPEIERELLTLRGRGQNLSREQIATYLIGQRVVAQQGKKTTGAKERRRQQEARPANGRGDTGGERRARRGGGDTVADIEAQFGDVPI